MIWLAFICKGVCFKCEVTFLLEVNCICIVMLFSSDGYRWAHLIYWTNLCHKRALYLHPRWQWTTASFYKTRYSLDDILRASMQIDTFIDTSWKIVLEYVVHVLILSLKDIDSQFVFDNINQCVWSKFPKRHIRSMRVLPNWQVNTIVSWREHG